MHSSARSTQSLSAKTCLEREIQFDPSNQASFHDTNAGQRKKNRSVVAIEKEILRCCAPMRGSGTTGTLSASAVKREEILTELCNRMNFEVEGDFDAVVSRLPKLIREQIETLVFIKDRLKHAFAILKKCHGTEARVNYYVLATSVASSPVSERDRHGMHRRVTDMVDIPRAKTCVPARQQPIRATWDNVVCNTSPIQVGEKVDSFDGPGTVQALHEDGSITIKLTHGAVVTFSSQGSKPTRTHTFTANEFSILITSAHKISHVCSVRIQPWWRPSKALDRLVAPSTQRIGVVEDHSGCCQHYSRCCQGLVSNLALHEAQVSVSPWEETVAPGAGHLPVRNMGRILGAFPKKVARNCSKDSAEGASRDLLPGFPRESAMVSAEQGRRLMSLPALRRHGKEKICCKRRCSLL